MTAVQEENERLWKLVGALSDALREALENLERMGVGVRRVLDKEELGLENALESVAEIGRFKKKIAVVRDLHVPGTVFEDYEVCGECLDDYPCPTIQALEETR